MDNIGHAVIEFIGFQNLPDIIMWHGYFELTLFFIRTSKF